jgi:hypothetical protein
MGLYKDETNLKTTDIAGAQPQVVKFQSKRVDHNPLDPKYNLSKVEYRPVTPPKFIRDQMSVDDIPSARPKVDKKSGVAVKNIMQTSDIDGTSSSVRHKARGRSNGYSSIDYQDVTKVVKTSNRCSNPLDPVYTVYDDDGKTMTIGEVDGSKPAKMPDQPTKKTGEYKGGCLETGDIAGAQTSTKGKGIFANV